jgi:hypothetical protein
MLLRQPYDENCSPLRLPVISPSSLKVQRIFQQAFGAHALRIRESRFTRSRREARKDEYEKRSLTPEPINENGESTR